MKHRPYVLIAAALAVLALSHAIAAPEDDGHADRLKAGYVFNFLKFVEWPAAVAGAKDAALRFALIGDNSLAVAIKVAIDGKSVQGRTVRVVTFPNAAAWQGAADHGQALFVTSARRSDWETIRPTVATEPVLTIADTPGFCADGGMLNMYEEENRIHFEANPGAAEGAGLKMRSELLKLATIVTTRGNK